MPVVNPYLNFKGNTEEAFNFYKSVFGGAFVTLQRFSDTAEAEKLPPADKEKIMHVALPLGKGNILMGTDMLESMGQKLIEGNNFSISLETESKEEADRLFNGLSAGGAVEMAMQKTFWGSYFGMLKDRFGIQWMVSFNERNN